MTQTQTNIANGYKSFLSAKSRRESSSGFDPLVTHDWLYGFQRHLLEWACRKGRSAIFADCGLGKTPMQLAWADNVVRKTNGRVLVLTALAVAPQTVGEAAKFEIDCARSSNGHPPAGHKIVVTNYERLHLFDASDFDGVVCDESSILKNFAGERRKEITEFMRCVKYRLLCTATAAPNDFFELGTSSDALGYLGARDMLTRFFKEDTAKDYLGWGRKTYRFRGHAEHPFWQWVVSWARACRKPSDLGFDDDGFILPPLIETESIVTNSTPREGMLFSTVASDLREQREERRITVKERCEAAAENVANHDGHSVIWCHLNIEGTTLAEVVSGGVEVSGSMSDEEKEEKLVAFQAGQIKTLITKPKIGCFGLNWQHCHNVVTFPSHSWEQYYQAVRRCWRFGQKNPVKVTVISTEGERGVISNLQRKAQQADQMFKHLVAHMNDAIQVDRNERFSEQEQVPSWL